MDREPIYLFITGGVLSSLGKGIAASSIGLLLERQGYPITMLKLDPYLNIDPGTMSPYQHGEVYVTDDGAETDLDLGHYHRFTHAVLTKASSVTSGQVFNEVLHRERRGEYLGKTVQVIPHITDEIKQRIEKSAQNLPGFGFVLVEIGGTVGDIESLPFLEAIRQFRYEKKKQCMNIHLTYVPYIKTAGEIKTKPTQHSVQALRQIGIIPDILLCRTETHIGEEERAKISLFCNVEEECVFEAPDVPLVYDVPVGFHKQNLEGVILKQFGLPEKPVDLTDWIEASRVSQEDAPTVRIGVVGKYIQHQDAYKSLFEALYHASCKVGCRLKLEKLDPEKFEHDGDVTESVKGLDGYLIPGGFGIRGWEGKLLAAEYCRKEKIPYFGICLGVQVLVVEFARNVLGLKDANSSEIDQDTKDPIISLLSEQREVQNLGGTMRLGAYPCTIDPKSLAYKAYNSTLIHERHRHRYEFNNLYKQAFLAKGAKISGINEKTSLAEVIELEDHPWMLGVQYHPEFLSKPTAPHPLFVSFIQASLENMLKKKGS